MHRGSAVLPLGQSNPHEWPFQWHGMLLAVQALIYTKGRAGRTLSSVQLSIAMALTSVIRRTPALRPLAMLRIIPMIGPVRHPINKHVGRSRPSGCDFVLFLESLFAFCGRSSTIFHIRLKFQCCAASNLQIVSDFDTELLCWSIFGPDHAIWIRSKIKTHNGRYIWGSFTPTYNVFHIGLP